MRDILVGPRVPHCNDIKGRDGDRWLEKFKPRFMAAHEFAKGRSRSGRWPEGARVRAGSWGRNNARCAVVRYGPALRRSGPQTIHR